MNAYTHVHIDAKMRYLAWARAVGVEVDALKDGAKRGREPLAAAALLVLLLLLLRRLVLDGGRLCI